MDVKRLAAKWLSLLKPKPLEGVTAIHEAGRSWAHRECIFSYGLVWHVIWHGQVQTIPGLPAECKTIFGRETRNKQGDNLTQEAEIVITNSSGSNTRRQEIQLSQQQPQIQSEFRQNHSRLNMILSLHPSVSQTVLRSQIRVPWILLHAISSMARMCHLLLLCCRCRSNKWIISHNITHICIYVCMYCIVLYCIVL